MIFVITKNMNLYQSGKHILLLLIWSLAFMTGAALAHTGSSAGHSRQILANSQSMAKLSGEQADCCAQQLCVPSQHQLNGDHCCRDNSIPVFGLHKSNVFEVDPVFFISGKSILPYYKDYLSSGYHFIWLPPKIG